MLLTFVLIVLLLFISFYLNIYNDKINGDFKSSDICDRCTNKCKNQDLDEKK